MLKAHGCEKLVKRLYILVIFVQPRVIFDFIERNVILLVICVCLMTDKSAVNQMNGFSFYTLSIYQCYKTSFFETTNKTVIRTSYCFYVVVYLYINY